MKNIKGLVSVIVPVFNSEDTIKLCIDSILSQNYKNFEILIVDDGSNDNSYSICESYLNEDKRIKLFHKENGGLSDARNYGLDRMSGQFVSFIDSDDIIHKDFLLEAINAFEKYDADIVAHEIIQFNNYEEINTPISNQEIEVLHNSTSILKRYFYPNNNKMIDHGVCSKLYKAELFENLRFENGKLHEDLFITYKLLEKCNTFVFTNKVYYFYYKGNENSICKNYDINNLNHQIEAIEDMRVYFKDNQSFKQELSYFVINQYLHWYKKSFELENSELVREKRDFMKKELIHNILKCDLLNIVGKLKIIIKMVI